MGVLLADDFYCVAYHERTGRSWLQSRVLGLGLAGALLGELVLFGRVCIDRGVIAVVDDAPPPDPLVHATLAQVLTFSQHRDVRTWLAFLARTATDAVAGRLVEGRVLQRVQHRRFGRRRVSYAPRDVNVVAWRPVRLAGRLTAPDPIEAPDVVLGGLVGVTGLARVVLWQPELREAGMARLSAEVARLHPSLRDLLAHVEAALGDAVLAPH
ncbi:GOLPH3/VPS74 family protein [Dactylosporangium sp. CA-139066]|uniref:GOLPH3/VPS74 family protein n=1 Tax=Dactylosporangium sp. CA-139066 TaxID=3239930 RepID=UPI003D9050F8